MRYLSTFMLTAILGAPVLGQSIRDCDVALGKNVRSLDVTSLTGEQLGVVKSFLASMSYEQTEAGGFLGIGKAIIGGDYSKEKHSSFRSSYFSEHESSFDYQRLRSVVPPEAFAAWSKCVDGVLNQVFRVDLRTAGHPTDLILEVSWKPVGSLEVLHVQGVGATNLVPNRYAAKLFEDGFYIAADQVKKFIVKRKDENRNALVVVHTTYGDREANVEAHVEPHRLVKQWMRTSEAGKAYQQTFSYTGPNCHGRPAKTVHQTERLTAAGPNVRIWDVDYACISGPAGWTYAPGDHRPKGEYGASYRVVDDGCSFTWGRHFTSGTTVIHHTAKYEVYREVCAPDCKAKGEHRR